MLSIAHNTTKVAIGQVRAKTKDFLNMDFCNHAFKISMCFKKSMKSNLRYFRFIGPFLAMTDRRLRPKPVPFEQQVNNAV